MFFLAVLRMFLHGVIIADLLSQSPCMIILYIFVYHISSSALLYSYFLNKKEPLIQISLRNGIKILNVLACQSDSSDRSDSLAKTLGLKTFCVFLRKNDKSQINTIICSWTLDRGTRVRSIFP